MTIERQASVAQVLGHAAFDELAQGLSLERRYATATGSLLTALRSSATLADAWPTVLQTFAELLAAKSARLWLNNAGRLSPELGLRVSPGDEPGEVALELVAADPTSLPSAAWLVTADHLLACGLSGVDGRLLCLPLGRDDELSAILCLALDRVPTEIEQARLTALGEQLGVAIADRA